MRNWRHIPEQAYDLAIVCSTAIWGASYVILKGAFDSVGPGWLLGVRFLVGSSICALVFRRRLIERLDRAHLTAGSLIGLSGGAAYLTQSVGLTSTTPGRNAFLTATYCVMAPFVSWAFSGKRPRCANVVAAFACLAGVAFLSLAGEDAAGVSGPSVGDALTLVSAALFALNIVQIEEHGRGRDPIVLTVVQLAVIGAVSLAWGVVREPVPNPGALTTTFWLQMAYLVILATVVTTSIQNVAQQHVPAPRAALLFSLESVFGAVLSVVFFHERMTTSMLLGFALIFAAVVLSELPGRRDEATRAGHAAEGEGRP